MCGIWAYLTRYGMPHSDIQREYLKHLEARGPEQTNLIDLSGIQMGFTRLAINGLNPLGMQPFQNPSQDLAWMCNGEIYNAKELEGVYGESKSGSDCEVIGNLWRSTLDPVAFARSLDGVFAVVIADLSNNRFVVARDPYGVRPLYYRNTKCGGMMFASERKALMFGSRASFNREINEFPPGKVWAFEWNEKHGLIEEHYTYHTVPWIKMADSSNWKSQLKNALVAAVNKRLMTERPVAALLSGGVDSSLIAALVQRELKALGKPPLKTFSIGMPGSTDLKYAKMVAEWIGSDHTEVLTTANEMFEVIPEVIRDIESYDTTTVRASVGNWMVAREIRRQTNCKVVFNGDGSDEIFGSYLYFYRAPSDGAFEQESERLLKEISKYDVLRSDRSISSHGLEPRTPFLDKQFVAVARSLPTELRRPTKDRCEKWALRTAFEDEGLLPPEVLWRRKEAFSDGVSCTEKSWYQEIQERIELKGVVDDDWQRKAGRIFSEHEYCAPTTKEQFWYRSLYEEMYPNTGDYWPFWMPMWSPGTTDPSARTLNLNL
jgi:asparagine synthase (glutamine-hydrolysing)